LLICGTVFVCLDMMTGQGHVLSFLFLLLLQIVELYTTKFNGQFKADYEGKQDFNYSYDLFKTNVARVC